MSSSYGSRELFAPRAGLVLVCRVLNFEAAVLRGVAWYGLKLLAAIDAIHSEGLT